MKYAIWVILQHALSRHPQPSQIESSAKARSLTKIYFKNRKMLHPFVYEHIDYSNKAQRKLRNLPWYTETLYPLELCSHSYNYANVASSTLSSDCKKRRRYNSQKLPFRQPEILDGFAIQFSFLIRTKSILLFSGLETIEIVAITLYSTRVFNKW